MKLRVTLMAIMVIAFSSITLAANKPSKLYVYGFSASFNDSTVYLTEVQELDTAWVDEKTEFLYSRDNYSYQLRDYLKAKGVAHPTCITTYAKTRKDVEKKYTKLRKKYAQGNSFDLRYITASEFQYSSIKPDDSEIASGKKLTKAEKKVAKQAEKEKQKAEKAKQKANKPGRGNGTMPPPPGGMGGERPEPPMH